MSGHRYKRVEKQKKPRAPRPPRGYHPARLVRERGDFWRTGLTSAVRKRGYLSGATAVALRDQPFDRHDGFLMDMMEQGVLPRCEAEGSDQ